MKNIFVAAILIGFVGVAFTEDTTKGTIAAVLIGLANAVIFA